MALVLDDFATENHLDGQDEQHKRTRHGKRSHIDAEELEQRVAGEEERQEQPQGRQAGLSRLDGLVLRLHAHEDGNGAEDVDDGGHHDERAEDFHEVDATEHWI